MSTSPIWATSRHEDRVRLAGTLAAKSFGTEPLGVPLGLLSDTFVTASNAEEGFVVAMERFLLCR